MRVALLALATLAACQHQPVFIADIHDAGDGARVVACEPGIGWERDRVLAACGAPAYEAQPPAADLVGCDVYTSRAVARHQSGRTVVVTQFETRLVAVCYEDATVVRAARRSVIGGRNVQQATEPPENVRRVKAIYTFRE